MQPALNAYNMTEKVVEANRSLAMVHVDGEPERARKVTFREVLVTYGPSSVSGI